MSKKRDNPGGDQIFANEMSVARRIDEIKAQKNITKEGLWEEYRFLGEQYQKMLRAMIKLTRVGDRHYKKLMDATQQIVEQKDELESLNRELRRANLTREKFYSIIAHDLRSPLQFLTFSAELMENDFDQLRPESTRDFAGRVLRTADRMSALLENLLEWSRSQYGEITCRPRSMDLHALLERDMEDYRTGADEKGIGLDIDVKPGTVVFADEDMARSVFRNLIGNAVKYTGSGGQINVSAECEGDFIVTRIADTGVGIPETRLDCLFKMGENLPTPGTGKEKGSGLGLLLCKEFVEMNGGRIWARSVEGRGSTFGFSLPMNEPQS